MGPAASEAKNLAHRRIGKSDYDQQHFTLDFALAHAGTHRFLCLLLPSQPPIPHARGTQVIRVSVGSEVYTVIRASQASCSKNYRGKAMEGRSSLRSTNSSQPRYEGAAPVEAVHGLPPPFRAGWLDLTVDDGGVECRCLGIGGVPFRPTRIQDDIERQHRIT